MKANLTFVFTLMLVCTGAAMAQTPDHLPPALETVCDLETGSAYGHCNAYCEAMDCELANDSDPLTEPSASAAACSKVRSKFEQATGRNLPCEVTCPCNDPAVALFFASFVDGSTPIEDCATGLFAENGIVVSSPGFASNALSIEVDGGQWICGGFPFFGIPITPEQGQFCAQLLEQAANSQGVTCLP